MLANLAVPGVDMLFVLANTLTWGRLAGFAATAGLMLGGAFHTIWGAMAVSRLLGLPPSVLRFVLFAGTAYLLWIGLTLVRGSVAVSSRTASDRSPWIALRQGALTCMLNPKAYVFTFSIYAQFEVGLRSSLAASDGDR